MLKVTIESDDVTKRVFSVEFSNETPWPTIIEDGVIPALRSMTFILPETEALMQAIESVGFDE